MKSGKKTKRSKRLFLLLMAALLSGALTARSRSAAAETDMPYNTPRNGGYNIIFIVADQERYFETPPAGTNWRARELLQSTGATFEKHYICSNVSTPSRSVMYTGRHITETKMTDNVDFPWQSALREDIATIGHLMREAGYYTAYKGKFHMLNEGAGVIPDSNSGGFDRAGKDSLEVYGFSDWNFEGDVAGSMLQGYHADEYIKGASVRWLRDTGASLNKSGVPFFLAVNFVNPHDIMFYNPAGQQTAMETNAAPPRNTVYAPGYNYLPPAWEHAAHEEGGIPAHREYHYGWIAMAGALPRDRETVKKFNDYYLNCIQDQDNSLMGLLSELERLGMMDNTIIILTSDHGEMGGSHGLTGKGPFMYESNIRVPFIIVHPAYKGDARRIKSVTSHLDIAPTVLDMTSLPAERKERLALSKGLAGHSLLPLLDGRAADGKVRDSALYAFGMISMIDASYSLLSGAAAAPDLTKRGLLRGIVTERYKFARYFSPLDFNTPTTLDDLYNRNDIELYDLETDPHERRNLAADPARRKTNAELIAEMNRRLNELIEREIGVDNGDEMAEALKFFGVER